MDIQEQIDQFLQIPEIKEIFSDHDIHWHVGEYSQGWYFDFSVPDYEKGFFLGAWNAWQAAKAQAVPEVITIGNELQSWVAVWSFKARHDREDYIVVDANLLAEKIEKLTGANA